MCYCYRFLVNTKIINKFKEWPRPQTKIATFKFTKLISSVIVAVISDKFHKSEATRLVILGPA